MKTFQLSKFVMISYLISNFMFSLNRKHLLIILLSLELIVLNLFFYVYIYLLLNLLNSIYFLVMFMVLTVCEGVLGVSILVYMIRVHGKDYVSVYSIFI
uniref:NADH-ubiquinone oxidoreductase chain 4L n=1 Tax=Limnephilus decipiens TaxID=329909 RepID=A0A1D5AVE1_9NEOP|nr:NADH dehydrogenase subunit 4L [Limnephilus decipiens]BAQ19276.1 NADH dehydrogenase subunit 4L [Limnephilus decipiens]BAQ19283.1 NADH dehydrogenase subunit 4L [Limnephilus decipiens]